MTSARQVISYSSGNSWHFLLPYKNVLPSSLAESGGNTSRLGPSACFMRYSNTATSTTTTGVVSLFSTSDNGQSTFYTELSNSHAHRFRHHTQLQPRSVSTPTGKQYSHTSMLAPISKQPTPALGPSLDYRYTVFRPL